MSETSPSEVIDSSLRSQQNGSGEPVGTAGGSLRQEVADDAVVDTAGGHDAVPGETPAGQGEPPDPVAQLRRENAELLSKIEMLQTVADAVNRNDDIRNELIRRERGDPRQNDEFVELDQMVDEAFNEKSAAALKKLLRKAAEVGDRRTESRLKPMLGQVQKTVAGAEFVRTLRQEGLPAEIVEDPDFNAHLRELRGKYRSFASLEHSDASAAASFAASKWKEKSGRRMDFDRERRRVEDAKTSSLNGRGSTAARTAIAEKVDVPMNSGMRGILDAIKRGVPTEKIHRV